MDPFSKRYGNSKGYASVFGGKCINKNWYWKNANFSGTGFVIGDNNRFTQKIHGGLRLQPILTSVLIEQKLAASNFGAIRSKVAGLSLLRSLN